VSGAQRAGQVEVAIIHKYVIFRHQLISVKSTRGQSNLTKSASRGTFGTGPIPRLGVTPGGRKLYH